MTCNIYHFIDCALEMTVLGTGDYLGLLVLFFYHLRLDFFLLDIVHNIVCNNYH